MNALAMEHCVLEGEVHSECERFEREILSLFIPYRSAKIYNGSNNLL